MSPLIILFIYLSYAVSQALLLYAYDIADNKDLFQFLTYFTLAPIVTVCVAWAIVVWLYDNVKQRRV